jgi:hypothetical protein
VELPQPEVEAEVADAGGRDAARVVDLGDQVRRSCRRQRRAVEVAGELADVLAARRFDGASSK